MVERADAAGVLVEAELGEIGGKDGAHAPGVRTDPDEAARFVAETGVDALAVAVGSSHAMTERVAAIDLELVARLARRGAGSPRAARLLGGSRRHDRARHPLGDHEDQRVDPPERARSPVRSARTWREHPAAVDSRTYVAAGREAVRREAARLLALFASTAKETG